MTDLQEQFPLKSPTTFEEQIQLLKSRGLIIEDVDKAIDTLKRVNYYRFTAYTLTVKENDKFFDGITFDHILRLYEFDMKLRLLLMEIFEYIEISFRSNIAYLIAHQYGPLGYRIKDNFQREDHHQMFLSKLDELLIDAKELFVEHHQKKYGGQFPVWAAFEVLTFGMLSKLFTNLKPEDQKTIAQEYYDDIPSRFISSWLYTISVVRNRCAHYSRIYNRKLTIKPQITKTGKKYEINNDHIFSLIFSLKYLVKDQNVWGSWLTRLEALIENYPEVDLLLMGFSEQWNDILQTNKF